MHYLAVSRIGGGQRGSSSGVRNEHIPKLRSSATLGEEPEVDGGAGLVVARSWHAHGPAGMECSQKLAAGTGRTDNE